MAEVAALTSIAKSALQLFSSLAKDESLLLWNSGKELQRLHLTIDTIGCLLQDVDKMQSKTESVQNCLSRLRGIMYDADDLFDALAAQVLRKKTMGRSVIFPKEVRLFFSKSNQLGLFVKTAHEVKSLRESLDAIRQDMNLCGFRLLDHPPVAQQVIRSDRNRTHSFVHEDDVIGRDEEREAIVNLLLPKGDTSDDRTCSVVAVIGFGGLGKTTLAQLVYNDERVKQGFDICLWACINYLSNLEQVLIEVIASKEGRHSELGLEKLQEKLREIIGGRKFLVVLDDLWDEDSGNWLHLETILRCGKIGSKVIVTTRSQKVAECLDTSKPCRVELGGLPDESAWSLFVKKAFQEGELDNHPELQPIGKEIVKSCRNVPPVAQQVIRSDRHRTHSFVHENDVIGRNEERDAIVNLLLPKEGTSDDRSFSVVAVIGFGGLGKTTLAQLVYNDERVKQGFDVRLWACINDLSNLEQVLIEIIASKERRHSDLGLEKLQEKLREIIGGRKFLVVLDDVWDEDSTNWRNLETILRCGSIGSRVIVTTRSQEVAKCVKASEPCRVNLGGLSDESAWALFVKTAFNEELDKCSELESVGKEIVRKCGNVPLAIVIIGALLHNRKKEERIWSDFLENELRKALSNSDTSHESIKRVLMVSYNDLLPNLKLCFAYCSLFPKDYPFEKDELVRLWVAQGFIKPSSDNERSLEELGEDCFFHLVERCFFQEVKEFYFEENIYFWSYDNHLYRHGAKMHDLLHDMAIEVAKTESILLDEVSIGKGKRESLRHISIASGVDDFFEHCSLVVDPKSIRTLLNLPKLGYDSSLNISTLASFRMLRTLGLQDRGITNVPDSIGELIHLRYLNLSYNSELQCLPRSICKLHHLMTLVLRNCTNLERLPLKIDKLVSLKELYIHGCNMLDCLPPGLTTLTSLLHLDRLIVHHNRGGLAYLNGLDNLHGVLRIELPKEGWPDAIGDAKRSNMLKKKKLDGIIIDWEKKGSSTSQEMGKADAEAVLDALELHKSRLEHLEIKGYGGEKLPAWFCMQEHLKNLCLYGCENVEYIEDEMKGSVCFPSLRTLKFESMKNLKGWWRQEKHEGTRRPCLAKVLRVTIDNCPELKGRMPLFEGIEYLDLLRVDVKLVTEILSPNCSSDQASFAPCDNNNKLKQMNLEKIKSLVCLREEWIRHLTALQTLNIADCSDLRWVSTRGLSHLTALKGLRLESHNCEIGDEEDDDEKIEKEVQVEMHLKVLRGLESLTLAVGDKHLHEKLQYLTSLTSLRIEKWKDVQLGDGEMGGVKLPSNALQNLCQLDIGFDEGESICHLPSSGIHNLRSLKTWWWNNQPNYVFLLLKTLGRRDGYMISPGNPLHHLWTGYSLLK